MLGLMATTARCGSDLHSQQQRLLHERVLDRCGAISLLDSWVSLALCSVMTVVREGPLGKSCLQGTAGILQICNIARHSVVIIYVPIYHAFYYLTHI